MTASKYRKKPVVIEAIQLTETNAIECIMWIWDSERVSRSPHYSNNAGVLIRTLEGDMQAVPGDFIIRGVNGEFYPCKPDIFAKTYESAAPRVVAEGYEPAENSAAKNVAMDAIEGYCDKDDIETDPDDGGVDLIEVADAVIEALLKAGVTIPEGIKDPHELKPNGNTRADGIPGPYYPPNPPTPQPFG